MYGVCVCIDTCTLVINLFSALVLLPSAATFQLNPDLELKPL